MLELRSNQLETTMCELRLFWMTMQIEINYEFDCIFSD